MEGEKQEENEARQGGRDPQSPSPGAGKRELARGNSRPRLAGR